MLPLASSFLYRSFRNSALWEQAFISFGNYLFVWSSSSSFSAHDAAYVISSYTVAIAFYPLYFAWIIQPLRTIYIDKKATQTYLLVTAFIAISAAAFFSLIFTSITSRSGTLISVSFLPLLFSSSFYFLDYFRRLTLLTTTSLKLLSKVSFLLLLARLSCPLFPHAIVFLVFNTIANIFFGILLLFSLFSFRHLFRHDERPFVHILLHDHLPLLVPLAPLGLLSFAVGTFPSLYSIQLLSLEFIFVSKIRSLFSLFNPFFEYLDGAYFLRRLVPSRRQTIATGFFALSIIFGGVLVSFLLPLLLNFIPLHEASALTISDSSHGLFHDPSLIIFLLSLSTFVSFSVRVFISLFRRSLLHGYELLVPVCALPCLFLALKSPTILLTAVLYFSLAFSQFVACLLIYLVKYRLKHC